MNRFEVSKFIRDVCPVRPKSFPHMSFFSQSYLNRTLKRPLSAKIMCGSKAEFYIDPVNPCVSDTDFLLYRDSLLVFGCDEEPRLPATFTGNAERIKCVQMESYSEYPGFCRLKKFGTLEFDWKARKYVFHKSTTISGYYVHDPEKELDREHERRINEGIKEELSKYYDEDDENESTMDVLEECDDENTIQQTPEGNAVTKQGKTYEYDDPKVVGPALKYYDSLMGEYDQVLSGRCPLWPNQAKQWIRRGRTRGWPKAATVREVVEAGCHVVSVRHRDRQYDRFQHRLSFSAAEVILLNSWNTDQQIVYHMLRYFAKRVLIPKKVKKENEVLCTYHLKTLMLWSCEERPVEWWMENCTVNISATILAKLRLCLIEGRLCNYFIPKANLFGHKMNQLAVSRTIELLDEFSDPKTLNKWFVENYVKPCELILQGIQVNSFDDHPQGNRDKISTEDIVSRYEYAIFDYYFTDAYFVMISEIAIFYRRNLDPTSIARNGFTVDDEARRTCAEIVVDKEIFTKAANDSWFMHFAPLLMLLYAEFLMSCRGVMFDDDAMIDNVTSWLVKKSRTHRLPENYKERLERSEFYFLRGEEFLDNLSQTRIQSSPAQCELLTLAAITVFQKCLQCTDRKSEYLREAGTAYLAALFHWNNDHKRANILCLKLIGAVEFAGRKTGRSKSIEKKKKLNAKYLRVVIKEIGIITGFVELFNFLGNDCKIPELRLKFDYQMTPTILAYCLKTDKTEYLGFASRLNASNTGITFFDRCILTVLKSSIFHDMKNSAISVISENESDGSPYENIQLRVGNSDFRHLLINSSLDLLRSFYNSVLDDFGVNCKVIPCYEALCAHKYSRYNDCLSICDSILQEADQDCCMERFAFANVQLLPPLDSFFDRDIQALVGFRNLFWFLCPQPVESDDDLADVFREMMQTFAQVGDVPAAIVVPLQHPRQPLDTDRFQLHEVCRRRYFIGRHFLATYLKLQCIVSCGRPSPEITAVLNDFKSKLSLEYVIESFVRTKVKIFLNSRSEA